MKFDRLDALTPLPDVSHIPSYRFTLDGGGRDMVVKEIQRRRAAVLLEIGVYLGGSSYDWLEASEDLHVIGLDPWSESHDIESALRKYARNPALSGCFKWIDDIETFVTVTAEHGLFKSALANLNIFKHRFHPLRAKAPQALYRIHEIGICPDIIYIDADKKAAELSTIVKLFPEAKICGDDWTWNEAEGFPMRRAVQEFASLHGFTVRSKGATWIIDKHSA